MREALTEPEVADAVGFIGLGIMGSAIAARLQKKVPIVVWNRTPSACVPLELSGATSAATAAEVFDRTRIVFLMLADERAIDSVLQFDGSIPFAGRTVVVMSTVAPHYSAQLARRVDAAGGHYVEAPVSGSRQPALEGTLVSMIAGDESALDRVEPLIQLFSSSVFRCGPVPAALMTKLAVNTFLVTLVTGLAESFHFAETNGVDLEILRNVLDTGPMASAVSRAKTEKLALQDWAPHAAIPDVLKNSRLIGEQARRAAVSSPLIDVCSELYAEAANLGHTGDDMIAVIAALRKRSDTRLHHVGRRVADALGLGRAELAALDPEPVLPRWNSHLRVSELAHDSVALSSLALSLISADRGGSELASPSLSLDPDRVQASFGSEKLFRIDGVAPPIWAPLSGFWRVSDGWVRTHGNYPHHAERLTELLGIPRGAARAEVEAAMRGWSRFELEDRAAKAGALAFAVRDPTEWRSHPQHDVLAQLPIVELSRVGDAAARAWAQFTGRPLSGVRVLDLTRVIAGPVATRDLAVAGADVLRIDSPRLPEPAFQHLDTGHEKRSALLDLDDPDDFRALQGLLARADVVVHGYRPTALARFGLDFDSLSERFPGIVVAQLSAWGTTGPLSANRGFDSLVQAATGISCIESADSGATPGALPIQALDHSTGHFLAAAISMALRAQRSRGGSYSINISLARIAQELLAAGRSGLEHIPHDQMALPTELLQVQGDREYARQTVTCAPPVLDFPGALTEYASPLHAWGSDDAVWR